MCYNVSMRAGRPRKPAAYRLESVNALWTWDSPTAKKGIKAEKLMQRNLANLLRQRVCHALRRGQKAGSAVRDLGCSIRELVTHLEKGFSPGMSWDNHGTGPGTWSIDHIIPLSSVDLTDRAQFLQVSHYMNLQPLWSEHNLSKGAKLLW